MTVSTVITWLTRPATGSVRPANQSKRRLIDRGGGRVAAFGLDRDRDRMPARAENGRGDRVGPAVRGDARRPLQGRQLRHSRGGQRRRLRSRRLGKD